MDWEIYDLDADEIVIRRPLFARPWGDAHSSKPMPRAAGSVNRARRCEHVQELKRFCEDNKTAVPAAGQRTLRQHASCDGHTRNLREAASGSSLRGERDRKHSRPRLRLRTVLSSERSPDGRRRFQALKSPRNLSSTSLHRPGSSCQSPLSAGADRVNSIGRKDLDCECYYPGVTVLPLVRNSLEGAEEGGSEHHSTEGKKDSPIEQKVDVENLSTVPLFVNPWNGRRATDDASSYGTGSIRKSAMSCHRPSPSNEWATSASDGFEYDSPSTPATSAFGSITSPAQSLRDKSIRSRDSKQIDARCLPNWGSSGRVQEITGSNLRAQLSPHGSQEHLPLRVRDLDASPSMTPADIQSKRNGRHWPLSSASTEGDEIRSASNSTYSPDNHLFEFPIRDRLASAPSIPATHEEPRELPSNYILNVGDSGSSTRSRSVGDLLSAMPNPEPENQSAQAVSSDRCGTTCQSRTITRIERSFQFHRRGVAVSRAIHQASNTQSPMAPGKAGSQSQLRTRALASITIPEHPPKSLFASVPRSPRTDRPSSPPNIPLPADPPVPPSRGSSYKSAATHGNASSESLVDPALFERSNLGSGSRQDHKPIFQAQATLRRNFSENALCNHEEIQKTSYSAPLSLASSARVSRIEYPQHSATESSEANGSSAPDWHDTQVVPSSPSYISPVYKNDFNPSRRSPLSKQPSRTFSPSQAPSPEQLESRLAFLERQNKMLQAALIAALDFGVATGHGHGTDSPRSGSGKVPRSTAATPVLGWGSGSHSVVSEEKDNNPVSTIR